MFPSLIIVLVDIKLIKKIEVKRIAKSHIMTVEFKPNFFFIIKFHNV